MQAIPAVPARRNLYNTYIVVVARVPVQGVPAVPARRNLNSL
jgi:hypothetical protein